MQVTLSIYKVVKELIPENRPPSIISQNAVDGHNVNRVEKDVWDQGTQSKSTFIRLHADQILKFKSFPKAVSIPPKVSQPFLSF